MLPQNFQILTPGLGLSLGPLAVHLSRFEDGLQREVYLLLRDKTCTERRLISVAPLEEMIRDNFFKLSTRILFHDMQPAPGSSLASVWLNRNKPPTITYANFKLILRDHAHFDVLPLLSSHENVSIPRCRQCALHCQIWMTSYHTRR
mmetsp:Transcript_31026/g.93050  ORF Transcript_31026/g.93050 Transcript_31026/m.93050 type:complete len:147 (+) Transcript_31026:1897-2337(+)